MPERRLSWSPAWSGALVLLAFVLLSMLNRWEMFGEAWGFWFFSRLFAETGELLVPSRSPLYTLYLNGFRWLGYPLAVNVEYVVTTFAAAAALAVFLKPQAGWWTAVWAAVLWIPFMEVAEPPIQKLALACAVAGLWLRRRPGAGRAEFSLSYACLALAYLFRPNFLLFFLLFAAWDAWRAWRARASLSAGALRPRRADLALLAVLALFLWFRAAPRHHPFNNYLEGTPTWFPTDAKSIGDGTIIQAMTITYLANHGSFRDKDWYFTSKELFGDKGGTLAGAIRANPGVFFKHLRQNGIDFFQIVVARTEFFRWYIPLRGSWTTRRGWFVSHVAAPLFLLVLLWGAWRAAGDADTRIFALAGLAAAGCTVLVMVHDRTSFPLVALLPLSAVWFGRKAEGWLSRRALPGAFLAVPLALLVLSNGSYWTRALAGGWSSLKSGRLVLMKADTESAKGAFPTMASIAPRCRGLMSFESTFIGAFTKIPLDRVYDVWEIPPFGRYGDAAYDGLRPDRVDCLFISKELSTGIGSGMNYQPRYERYIRPYAESLKAAGWSELVIDGYGTAVVPAAGS